MRPNNGNLHVVPDIRRARKSTQGRGKGLLNMTVSLPGHLDLQAGDVQVGEHAIVVRAARIVKWDLKPVSVRASIDQRHMCKGPLTLNSNGYSYVPAANV